METHRIPLSSNSRERRTDTGQLQPGTNLVNRYLIQEVIGVGGMGSVYRARDLHFPNVVKLVAVKEMINQAPDPLVRQTIVQNFEREANILATLSHSSIPRIYDYFTLDNRSYLVEEFINGRDLEVLLNQTEGFLPEEQVLDWAIQLCEVLSYLHNHKPQPVVFRDMKPSNVMIFRSLSRLWPLVWGSTNPTYVLWSTLIFLAISNLITKRLAVLVVMVCLLKQ